MLPMSNYKPCCGDVIQEIASETIENFVTNLSANQIHVKRPS
jgi:hypothetical protein